MKNKPLFVFAGTAIGILAVLMVFTLFRQSSEIRTDKFSKYGKWYWADADILAEDFHQTLPEIPIALEYGAEFFYKSAHTPLGDPNFLICVKLSFPDEESYQTELKRYSCSFPLFTRDGSLSVYAVQFSESDQQGFFDEKTYDGMFYNFEVVVADDSNRSIEVLNARLWDYSKDSEMGSILGSFCHRIVS